MRELATQTQLPMPEEYRRGRHHISVSGLHQPECHGTSCDSFNADRHGSKFNWETVSMALCSEVWPTKNLGDRTTPDPKQYYICEAKPLPLWVLWRLLCKHKRMLLFWVLETSVFTSHSVLKKKSLLLKNLFFPPGSKHLPRVHRGTRKSTWKCSNFTVIRKGVILHLR